MASTRTTAQLQATSAAAHTADMLGLAIFFALLKTTAIEIARLVCFPLAAALSLAQTIIAWRIAQVNGKKRHLVFNAAVDTAAFLGITTAVVIGIGISSVASFVAPLIFTAVSAVKSIIKAGVAVYNWGKSTGVTNPEDKIKYQERAKENAIQSVAGLIVSAAVGVVLVAGKTAMLAFGVVAASLNAVYGLTKLYSLYKNRNNGYQPLPSADPAEAAAPAHEPAPAPQAMPGPDSPALISSLSSSARVFDMLENSRPPASKPIWIGSGTEVKDADIDNSVSDVYGAPGSSLGSHSAAASVARQDASIFALESGSLAQTFRK